MPHPERNVEPFHAPLFTAGDRAAGHGPGLAPFRRAIETAIADRAAPTAVSYNFV